VLRDLRQQFTQRLRGVVQEVRLQPVLALPEQDLLGAGEDGIRHGAPEVA
jgi:hypothetical protein